MGGVKNPPACVDASIPLGQEGATVPGIGDRLAAARQDTAPAPLCRFPSPRALARHGARPSWTEPGGPRGHAVLESPCPPGSYFGIPAAGGVMHTLNLRLAPEAGRREMTASHGYVRIADRTKDLIKLGGEWISSVDLENAILASSGKRSCPSATAAEICYASALVTISATSLLRPLVSRMRSSWAL